MNEPLVLFTNDESSLICPTCRRGPNECFVHGDWWKEPKRVGRHYLSNVDPVARTAICAVCGPTAIKTRGKGKWGWGCAYVVRQKRRGQKRRQRMGVHAREPVFGACPLCGKKLWLIWDHDHLTGAGRGHICPMCNSMIGFAFDDPAVLRAAAEYLEERLPIDNGAVRADTLAAPFSTPRQGGRT